MRCVSHLYKGGTSGLVVAVLHHPTTRRSAHPPQPCPRDRQHWSARCSPLYLLCVCVCVCFQSSVNFNNESFTFENVYCLCVWRRTISRLIGHVSFSREGGIGKVRGRGGEGYGGQRHTQSLLLGCVGMMFQAWRASSACSVQCSITECQPTSTVRQSPDLLDPYCFEGGTLARGLQNKCAYPVGTGAGVWQVSYPAPGSSSSH